MGGLTPPQLQGIQSLDHDNYRDIHDRLKLEEDEISTKKESRICRTLKLLDKDLAQFRKRSGSNIPHDVDEGVDAAEVDHKIVVHRVNGER